jgi:hypothetical protein
VWHISSSIHLALPETFLKAHVPVRHLRPLMLVVCLGRQDNSNMLLTTTAAPLFCALQNIYPSGTVCLSILNEVGGPATALLVGQRPVK